MLVSDDPFCDYRQSVTVGPNADLFSIALQAHNTTNVPLGDPMLTGKTRFFVIPV